MPKMRWNPDTGERVVFADDETPPDNFLPCHPADPDRETKTGASAPAPEPDAKDTDLSGGMTKTEIEQALKAGNVGFDPSDKKAVLADLLVVALKTVLTDRGVAYDENETAKSLLDKATVPQE